MFGDYEDRAREQAEHLLDQASLSDILQYFAVNELEVLTLLINHGIIEVPVDIPEIDD